MERMTKMHTWFLVEKPEGNDHWEDLDIGWIILLKRILQRNMMGWSGLDSSGSVQGSAVGSCRYGESWY
jgi:hypothetical protein